MMPEPGLRRFASASENFRRPPGGRFIKPRPAVRHQRCPSPHSSRPRNGLLPKSWAWPSGSTVNAPDSFRRAAEQNRRPHRFR